jgi:pimeloyl-ACP methyl ester carboxylesterase
MARRVSRLRTDSSARSGWWKTSRWGASNSLPSALTLAVWGTEDPINPISVARMTFRSERNIQLIEVKDGTHTPHEDTPDIVAELVLEFLK